MFVSRSQIVLAGSKERFKHSRRSFNVAAPCISLCEDYMRAKTKPWSEDEVIAALYNSIISAPQRMMSPD